MMLEADNQRKMIIDVREADEFAVERIPGSINVPLSRFAELVPGVLFDSDDREVVLMCRSGKRATLAADEAVRLGFAPGQSLNVYSGGIQAWKDQGLPVEKSGVQRLPIMRQVQVVIGSTVLLASIGVLLGAQGFAWLTAFFGAGLLFAGFTGFCGLAMLMARMPWNRGVAVTSCTAPGANADSRSIH
jgi:rhodanese-related sulfurtransferase